jgi:O-antigen/teichoic acid export membrane protein
MAAVRLSTLLQVPRRAHLALWQSVGTGVGIQLTLLASGPLIARMLGPTGRGQLAAIMIWPAALTFFGTLGLPAGTTYAIARGKGQPRELSLRMLKYALPQTLVILAVQFAIFDAVLGGRGDDVWAAALVSLCLVPVLLAQQYGIALLQGAHRFRLFNAARVLPTTLYAIFVAAIFVSHRDSLMAIVVAWLVANTVTTLLCYVGVYAYKDAPRQQGEMTDREMFSFGVRGLFVSGSPIEAVRLDQMALAIFLPAAALGTYVVGLAITNLPSFVSKSVGVVAFPTVAREKDAEQARRMVRRYTLLDLWLSLLIVIPLFLLAHWVIPLLFGNAFQDAVAISYLILPGTVFLSVRRVLAEGLRGLGHPGIGTVAEIVALVWLIGALAICIPLFGVRGAAVAMTTAYAASLLVTLVGAARARRGMSISAPEAVTAPPAEALAQ